MSRMTLILAALVAMALLVSTVAFNGDGPQRATAVHLADDLVAYLPFDDGLDPTADLTTHGNDGDVVGATYNGGGVGEVPGNLDALDFDGSADYVDAGADSSLDITGPISLAAWIRSDSIGSWQEIIAKGDYASGAGDLTYFLAVSDTGYIRFGHNLGGDGDFVDSATTLSAGTLYHVAATFDPAADAVKIYINGALDSTGTITSDPSSNSDPLYVGALQDGAGILNPFDGIIDEVRIYDPVLTAAEVAALADHSSNNFTVTVTPETAYNQVDTDHTLTISLAPALSFIPVLIEGAPAGACPAGYGPYSYVRTDGNGEIECTWTESTAQVQTITACIDISNIPSIGAGGACNSPGYLIGAEPDDTGTKTWVDMSMTPESAANSVDDVPHFVVVDLGLSGGGGIDIAFEVTGDNPDSGTASTGSDYDDDGDLNCLYDADSACFDYPNPDGTSANKGKDTIKACLDANSNDACDAGEPFVTGTKYWVNEAFLDLTPGTDINPKGTAHTVTLNLGDADLEGMPGGVHFDVSGANTTSAERPVGPGGQASFGYTGSTAGVDTIVACADLNDNDACDGGEPQDTAVKYWVDPYASVSGKFPARGRPLWQFRGLAGDAPGASAVGSIAIEYKSLNRTCIFTPGASGTFSLGESAVDTGSDTTDITNDTATMAGWVNSCGGTATVQLLDKDAVAGTSLVDNPPGPGACGRADPWPSGAAYVDASNNLYDITDLECVGGWQPLGVGSVEVVDLP